MAESVTFYWSMDNIEQYTEYICLQISKGDIVSSVYYDPDGKEIIVAFKDKKKMKFILKEDEEENKK